MVFTVPDVPGGKRSSIVLLMRRGRLHSKYYDLTCFCGQSRKRKNGTCKHTDAVFAMSIRSECWDRIRVTQPLGDSSNRGAEPHG